jgi:glutaredoxin-like protein
MSLISEADQEKLRAAFSEMTSPVRMVFFTQTLDCETCLQARQILDELPPLSDKISIEEVNLILEGDRAKQYGIDRAPAIALVAANGHGPDAAKDSRIRFLGTPAGYEFISLIQAVLLVGGRPASLTEENRARLAAVNAPVTIQVFTTPTCPHCPRAVSLAHEMAFASPNITAYAVEATEFPDLARKYHVSGVPKTVVNDTVEILGALPQDAYVVQALSALPAGPGEPDNQPKG